MIKFTNTQQTKLKVTLRVHPRQTYPTLSFPSLPPDETSPTFFTIVSPTTKKLRQFIGLINYYNDNQKQCAYILQPLISTTGKNIECEWSQVHQCAFDSIKKIVAKNTILRFPNFTRPFDVHTDASNIQLGGVVSQNNSPSVYFS